MSSKKKFKSVSAYYYNILIAIDIKYIILITVSVLTTIQSFKEYNLSYGMLIKMFLLSLHH